MPITRTQFIPSKVFRAHDDSRWLTYSFLIQLTLQICLLSSFLAPGRTLIRALAYGSQFGLLYFAPNRHVAPISAGVYCIIAITILSLLHPEGNTWMSAVAQVGLYVAILAPALWVQRIHVTEEGFRNLTTALWLFHSASATVGILQVSFPGRFQPAVSTAIQALGENIEGLLITTASGELTFRPMGLTDTPGGAAVSGYLAFLLGLGVLFEARTLLVRAAVVSAMIAGLGAILLSQTRAYIVLAAVASIVVLASYASRAKLHKWLSLMLSLAIAAALSFTLALSLGGSEMLDRLATLVSEPVTDVYYSNRGRFLEQTIEEFLPAYPLGAGLGRWGMTQVYFGDPTMPTSPPLWVEIQWTAWLFDGGVPLVAAYSITILVIVYRVAVLTRLKTLNPSTRNWAAVITGYNVGIIAFTFSYPVFVGQSGLEFWTLNAALLTLCYRTTQ